MKRSALLIVTAVVLLLGLLACNLGGIGGEEAATPAASELESDEDVEAPPDEVEAPDEEESQPADQEGLDLSGLTDGLGGLSSYKSTFKLGFAGKDEGGEPVNGTWESREEFIREPAAQRIAFVITGFEGEAAAQGGTFELITVGDTSYMVTEDADGTRTCVSMSSGDTTGIESGMFSPAMMGGVSGAQYVGSETVNGIPTKRYTWSESGLSGLGFASAKGEVWVAEDGEYTVKYTGEASGKGALMGPEWDGTLTFEYDLTEPNGSFVIEPPADCQTAASDIPLMADAYDKASFGEMQSYTSDSSLEAVRAFYEAEMPANGWQLSGEPVAMEGFATLEFTKDGRTAQLVLAYDADAQATSVIITTSGG